MKVAYTGWTWLLAGPNTPDEQKIRMFEQSMKEIAYLGYDCAENFAFIADFIKPEQVKEICAKYNLPLVNVYGHFSTEVEAEVDRALEDLGVVLDEVGLFLPREGVDTDGRPEAPDADRQDGQDDDRAPTDFAVVHADPAFRFPGASPGDDKKPGQM